MTSADAGVRPINPSGEGSAKKVEEVADANATEKEDIDILGIEAMESDGESSSSSSSSSRGSLGYAPTPPAAHERAEENDDADDDSIADFFETGPAGAQDEPQDGCDDDRDFRCGDCGVEMPTEAEEAPIKRPRNPADPTPEEREAHMAKGHLPYRPWCSVCVAARGREDPHYDDTKKEKEEGLP